LLALPVVAGGTYGKMLLYVLVRGPHEDKTAVEHRFAGCFGFWPAVDASRGHRS
jgi:hypothetical protein